MDPLSLLVSKINVKESELDKALEANDLAKAATLTDELTDLSSQVKVHKDNEDKLAQIKAAKASRSDFMSKPVYNHALPGANGSNGGNGSNGANALSATTLEAGDTSLDRQKSLSHFYQMVGLTSDYKNRNLQENAIQTLEHLYSAPTLKGFNEAWEKANGNAPAHMKAALAESAGITGGYTVPPEYSDQLFQYGVEDTVLVGKTDDYPMNGRELVFPQLDQTAPGVSAGQTPFFGGIVASWGAEALVRTETEPKFREVRLVANELSGLAYASRNILLDNVVALEKVLTRNFGMAIAWYRDYAYLQGNGVNKPQGILTSPCTATVTRASANTISYADIAKMYGKLMPQSVKRGFWVMQQSAVQSMLQMTDAANHYVIQPYYNNSFGPAAAKPVMTMLGMPVITTEKLPALGTKGDLLLIDPQGYVTGTRQDIEIGASEHFRFSQNQMTYRFLFRGDGMAWMNNPITLQDGSTTISPFVVLV